jgi:hypothetical protein
MWITCPLQAAQGAATITDGTIRVAVEAQAV